MRRSAGDVATQPASWHAATKPASQAYGAKEGPHTHTACLPDPVAPLRAHGAKLLVRVLELRQTFDRQREIAHAIKLTQPTSQPPIKESAFRECPSSATLASYGTRPCQELRSAPPGSRWDLRPDFDDPMLQRGAASTQLRSRKTLAACTPPRFRRPDVGGNSTGPSKRPNGRKRCAMLVTSWSYRRKPRQACIQKTHNQCVFPAHSVEAGTIDALARHARASKCPGERCSADLFTPRSSHTLHPVRLHPDVGKRQTTRRNLCGTWPLRRNHSSPPCYQGHPKRWSR